MQRFAVFFIILLITLIAWGDTQRIPTVLVKAKPHHEISSGLNHLITRADLQNSNVGNLADALADLGGITLIDSTGNGSRTAIGMRGFGSNATSNTLLQINGIPITNPDMAPPDLNNIPLPEIKQIEIIAGSESVLYGDQAVGGVINITLQENLAEKAALACSAGSYNLKSCYGNWQNQVGRLHTNFAFGSKLTNNYRDNNNYNQNILHTHFNLVNQRERLDFNLQLGKENMQYPGALTGTQVLQNRRQAQNTINHFNDWNDFLNVRYIYPIQEQLTMTLIAARRAMRGEGVLSSNFTQNRLTYYVKPQLDINHEKVKLNMGADVSADQYHLGSAFGITEDNQQKYGAFLMAHFFPQPKLTLQAGIRGAGQNTHLTSTSTATTLNRALATTLGLTYFFNPHLQFYLRRAGSFRFPKADESGFSSAGVGGLRTQRGVSYETGVRLHTPDQAIRAGLYQLNLRDEIMFDPQQTPQEPFGSNRNLAPTIRRGISFSANKQWQNKLKLGLQYNYVNARYQTGTYAGNRIPLVSESIILANALYKLTERWQIYLESLFTGNQYSANDDANAFGKMGGYTLFNISLRYQLNNFSAAFRLNNLFNRQYYFYTLIQSNQVFFYPAPERNFLFTLNYHFN